MRAADRSLDIITFVSEHFRDVIRRRLSELAGLALISLAVLGAIALATWSIQDPSLSHATQKPIHNLLGFPGAIFADLAMQLLGLASILLLVPELLLGWRLISHRPVGEKWRGLLWIVATFLAAAFASTLPHIGSWPLPTGLGGVAGDAVLRAPAWIFGSPLGGFMRFILCIVFGLATAATLVLAVRAPDQDAKSAAREIDDEDDSEKDDADGDHASAWLGMIVHALLSWKARIGRMIRGDVRARTPMPVAQGPRHEPRFDGDDSDYEDETEEEDDEEESPAPRRRAAPRAAARRGANGYTLPSLNSSGRAARQRTNDVVARHHRRQRNRTRKRAAGLRRAWRNHQRASRTCRHSLRA